MRGLQSNAVASPGRVVSLLQYSRAIADLLHAPMESHLQPMATQEHVAQCSRKAWHSARLGHGLSASRSRVCIKGKNIYFLTSNLMPMARSLCWTGWAYLFAHDADSQRKRPHCSCHLQSCSAHTSNVLLCLQGGSCFMNMVKDLRLEVHYESVSADLRKCKRWLSSSGDA